jgi:hypothetical protein
MRGNNREISNDIVYEKHHIIPRSLNGTDDKSNICFLTPREHFICHLLLPKFYSGIYREKMIWALHRMSFSGKYKLNSRMYEYIRRMFIDFITKNHPSKKESWRIAVSESVKKTWENSNQRRTETSKRMKDLWKNGKIVPLKGKDNGMFGKIPSNKGKKFPGTGKSGKNNPSAKKFTIITPKGEYVNIECLKTYCDEMNLTYGCMKKVAQGKNKQHRGYSILRKEGH